MTADVRPGASARTLAAALSAGGRVDPDELAGWQWHGTSLGLPAWLERLTWRTFIKAFVREPDGRIRGWNVRVVQPWHDRGGAPFTPRRDGGVPVTFGHFAIAAGAGAEPLLLDYGRGGNRRGDPVAALRDPLVALDRGRLLGRTLVAVAGRIVPTPSYFLLERGPAVDHVPPSPIGGDGAR